MIFASRKNNLLVAGTIIFVLGILIGQYIGKYYTKIKTNKIAAQAKPVRGGGEDYKFINPLLGYDTAKATEFGEYEGLQAKMEKKVKDELDKTSAGSISIYFRDMSRGRWLGVNEDNQYSPASLLKVPVMMLYYKLSESNSEILNQKMLFAGGSDMNSLETIKGSKELVVGQTYTVDELINYMIIYSDNDALELLYKNLNQLELDKFFSDFGVLLPNVVGGPQDFISPKTYALFFRVLYGSTYLSRYDSEKALRLLSQVEYRDGIVSGVPNNLPVSHKFGEYGTEINNQTTERELHDCGVVYYPNHPYLICIMTKGGDINNLQRIIKETSQIIYNEIEALYR